MDPLRHKIEKISDFGTSEPWVARIMFSIMDLVDHLPFEKYKKDEIKKWVLEISKELNAAYESLIKIEELEVKDNAALYSKHSQYENLYSALWRAYKDRFQKACGGIGYDIGFLFEKDKIFEERSQEFIKDNPEIRDSFRKMLKIDRRIWQNGLSDFRNLYIEHKEIGEEIEKIYYKPDSARKIFENVWQAMEDTLVVFINSKLQDPFTVIEIPEEKRDPACPVRFIVGLKGTIDAK